MSDDARTVRAILVEINDAWCADDADPIAGRLRPHFADEAVIVGPKLAVMAHGGDAAAESYADFVRSAVVHDFTMDEPAIHSAGDTLVATYRWRIRYDLDATTYDETGDDVMVFRRDAGRWRVTWRAMLPDPAGE